jgi:ATP-binding cassette subfamily C protein CydC
MLAKKKDVILSILFGYIAGMTAVGLFAANGYLISRAALEPPLYVLITMVAVVKIGSFLRALSRYAERYYSHRATFTMLSDLRVRFYEKLELHATRLFSKYRSGDLLARIVGDVESLQNFFLRVLYPPIIIVMVFLSTIFFVSFYSISISILLLIGLLLTGLVIPAWFAKQQKQVSYQIREKRAYLSTEVTEWFHGFRELKIHQKLTEKEKQLVNASEQYILEQKQEGVQSVYNHSINQAFSFIISWGVLLAGVFLVSTGQLDGVFLAMLVMMSFIVFEHSTPMAAFPIYYDESERSAKRLSEVEETEVENTPSSKTILEHLQAPTIELDHVSFTFPHEHRQTIKDVTITLPSGSKTAIVGPSGSGKSTLLQLILHTYPVDKGNIRVGRVPVNEIELESLWAQSNVVLQDNHFFYGSIKDNLLLSNGKLWSDSQLQQLLADVQLPHISLSDQVFEKGYNLSGGEKQRLAIARAVAKGSSLWLLDEPTSSLDRWTEKCVYELLFRVAKDDTLLVISHRLEGLEKMDQIIVMDQGKVVEKGSFDELIEKQGYFYKLKQIENDILR